jgi:hypothetical protein
MEQAFIEHLDQIYFDGYGDQFKDNPDRFYRQLAEFSEMYGTKKIRL